MIWYWVLGLYFGISSYHMSITEPEFEDIDDNMKKLVALIITVIWPIAVLFGLYSWLMGEKK